MKPKSTIERKGQESNPMDYEELISNGLEQAQLFSHDIWTDFNEHDPGVTILEQLCYALTDLNYRTEFSIEDILAGVSRGETSRRYKHSFYPASDVLFNRAVTINDYRKILINYIPGVANAWVTALQPEYGIGFSGKYSVDIMPEVGFGELDDLQNQALKLLNNNRNLCENFTSVNLLQPTLITPSAEIHLKESANPVNVQAQVYFAFETYFTPLVGFFHYHELIEQGYSTNEIMEGPLLLNGFIKDSDLTPKLKEIRSGALIKKILEIEGVESVQSLGFLDADSSEPQQVIPIQEGFFPQLDYSLLSNPDNGCIKLLRKQIQISDLDPNEVHHVLIALRNSQPNNFRLDLKKESVGPSVPIGEGQGLKTYDTIQNGFPSYYMLREGEIVDGTSDLRQAQARQLKGYLMFFDQLMANYLAQLSNVWKLLSFETQEPFSEIPEATYYFEELYDIPDVGPLLSGYDLYSFEQENFDPTPSKINQWNSFRNDQNNSYRSGLVDITQDTLNDLKRKREFLDHLMARVGYEGHIIDTPMFEEYVGQSMNSVVNRGHFLKKFPNISANRGGAFNVDGWKWGGEILEEASQVQLPPKPKKNSEVLPWKKVVSFNKASLSNASGLSNMLNHVAGLQNIMNSVLRMNFEVEKNRDSLVISFLDQSNVLIYQFTLEDAGIALKHVREVFGYFIKELIELGNSDLLKLNNGVSFGVFSQVLDKQALALKLNSTTLLTLYPNQIKDIQGLQKMLNQFLREMSYLYIHGEGLVLIEHLLLAPPANSAEYMFWFGTPSDPKLMRPVNRLSLNGIKELAKDIKEGNLALKSGKRGADKHVVALVKSEQPMMLSNDYGSSQDANQAQEIINQVLGDLHSGAVSLSEVIKPYIPFKYADTNVAIDIDFLSMQSTLILPDWVPYYENPDFQEYFINQVNSYSPAHVLSNCLWLSRENFDWFYENYLIWLISEPGEYSESIRNQLLAFLYQELNSQDND